MKNVIVLFLLFLFSFTSCSKDDVYVHEYNAAVYEMDHATNNEFAMIEECYLAAFNYAGLVHGKGSYYMYSDSREKILYACSVAEKTIRDAQIDFKGFYVYKVKEDGQLIYYITFGKKRL